MRRASNGARQGGYRLRPPTRERGTRWSSADQKVISWRGCSRCNRLVPATGKR
jgi:hypothetical protein